MSGYCDIAPGHPLHGPYHDHEYGFPLTDQTQLFERLCLEIFQAGLSWAIVLKKRPALQAAFAGFDPVEVAAFDEADYERLMADPGIIRHRAKLRAVIENAKRVLALAERYGSFSQWLEANRPHDLKEGVKLFRATFLFTGPEVVNEFLMSIGYLPGAHRQDCPVQTKILELNPIYMRGS